MDTSKLNQLIPKAIDAIKESKMNECKDAKTDLLIKAVPSALKGYIPAMGASILQSGLLPAVAFYSNNSGKEDDSTKLLKAILLMLPDQDPKGSLIDYILKRCRKDVNIKDDWGAEQLDAQKLNRLTAEILTALTALKLAVRTFKIQDKL